jgi:hypothetical protein
MISFDDETKFLEALAEHFTPSKEILTEERLRGREQAIKEIRRALGSPGRQVFIYGDRGVGKSSVAATAAFLNNSSTTNPIRINCSQTMGFSDVFNAIINESVDPSARLERKSRQFGLNVGLPDGPSIGANYSTTDSFSAYSIDTVADAIDAVRAIALKREGRTIIVIDEFERVSCADERSKFAEFIKAASSIEEDVRFIFCGIGETVDEILGAHFSTGRYIEPVELEPLRFNYLQDIITTAADQFQVSIDNNFTTRISIISDGYPHYVHLIGEQIFTEMYDKEPEANAVSYEIFKSALSRSLKKSEPTLRLGYQKATEKTKNKDQYELALWSLADKSETRRQVSRIYDESLLKLLDDHTELARIDKAQLNARLLNLRDERHGKVVVGHGAGWFSFRENVFRGYVRMTAEAKGVSLRPQD